MPIGSARDSWRQRGSLVLMMVSGFAALGYQIVWTQQCALWLGHESAAVLAIVAAFFGGLSCGALLLGPRIEASGRPLRWYAGCEAVIALWGLVLVLAMAPCSSWLLAVTGAQPTPLRQWTVAFSGCFILLLPATAAMGATLPAMERMFGQLRDVGRSIAPLYACNTLGAVFGVLATAFWLIPELGLLRTAGICIALNALSAAAALVMFPRASVAASSSAARSPASAHRTVFFLALTGLLGIGYEVVVVRVLSQVTEDTVYTFALLLAVYLVGTAGGAAAYQRWFAANRNPAKVGDGLFCALATACLIGTASLWAAEHFRTMAGALLGTSMAAALATEALLAIAAFGLPTIVMGALFSHLCAAASTAGVSFGRALGANTCGAAVAPVVFGVLAMPLLGPKLSLLAIVSGYLALLAFRAWRTPLLWLPATAVLALVVWAPLLAFIDIPEGGRVVSYQDGVMAAVSVVEDADGVARLRINNRQQEGSSATRWVDGRQAWLPLMLHPAPRRVLFLGLGTGITASTAAQDPTVEVDAVELLPEVIAASAHFTRAFKAGASTPRLRLIAADARRYIRVVDGRYDVIVSDNFHPARSGSGALYTVEHFKAVRERLAAGGVFCQWLPLHQLDLGTLRSIVQSFIAAYPQGGALLASNSLQTPVLGLVGRSDAGRYDVAALHNRLANTVLAQTLADSGIEDDLALLGSFVAGPAALRRFAGDAPLNTDDLPVVAYRAPRVTYAPQSLPRDRLVAVLRELAVYPAELFKLPADAAWSPRLAAYRAARMLYIESGLAVHPTADVQGMLAQVRAPLLSALHVSPDFRPAYDPLLRMAGALAQTDVAAAQTLLEELMRVQPARQEAAQLRRQIAPE
jgi:spermidine synthase